MRSGIALLLLAVLATGGCNRQSQAPQQAEQTEAPPPGNVTVVRETIGTIDRSHKGEPAPDTAFADPDGRQTTLAAFRGKPLLLNLWATWCAPCIKEMPTLDALAAKLDGKVQVLALSQDGDSAPEVKPFLARNGFKRLQAYIDRNGSIGLSMNANLPTTILYDSQGREVWRMAGGMDWTGQTEQELVAEAN